jgi:hypothetical protein
VTRSIVVGAVFALVVAACNLGRSQRQEPVPAPSELPDPGGVLSQPSTPADEATVVYGARRYGPLYEEGRLPPPTDDRGWPADWEKWPHLSIDVFGLSREFSSTREYRNGPSVYGNHLPYGHGPYGPNGYGNGPFGPNGAGPYGSYGYGTGAYAPHGFGRGWGNRDLFSSDSGFALRYGYPDSGPGDGQNSPSFGQFGLGAAYGVYPPWFGYGPYGWQPSYFGYGPGFWGGVPRPYGGYGPYFGW